MWFEADVLDPGGDGRRRPLYAMAAAGLFMAESAAMATPVPEATAAQ